MALGKTLGEVLTMTLHECKVSAQSALSQDVREQFKHFITTTQEMLVDDFDWPDFDVTTDLTAAKWFVKALAAGQRFYDFPTGMDPQTCTGVEFKLGTTWLGLERGITRDDYSCFNSDDDVRATPPQKWDFHGLTQFEVWPMPSETGTVSLNGRQAVALVTAESTVMKIDSIALAFFAAARYYESKADEVSLAQASLKMRHGMKRLSTLKIRRSRKAVRINFAQLGGPKKIDPRDRVIVAS